MSEKKEKQPDDRVGKHSVYEPLVCAVTGRDLTGQLFTTVKLSDGYYFRILTNFKQQADMKSIRNALLPLVSTKSKSTKSSGVKTNDE